MAPGDYLMGDGNGVVHIPRDLAAKVVKLVPSQVEADERVREDLGRGRGFAEAAAEWRAKVVRAEGS